MPRMKRFLVAGSRRFNNYFIAYRQLSKYLPADAVICNGGADGADAVAAVYADCNGHIYEAYEAPWDRYGKKAGFIRNQHLAKICDHAIFFWDGKSESTKELIGLCRQNGMDPVIVDITEEDIITPHPGKVVNIHREPYDVYIGRGKGSIFGNPFPITEKCNREYAVSMYINYVIKTPSILSRIFELKDKVLGCFCAPQLCHGDAIVWMLENATPEIKEILKEFNVKTPSTEEEFKKYLATSEAMLSKWPKSGERVQVVTTTGWLISEGYVGIVHEGNRHYLEISENDICRSHLWMGMDERQRIEEEDPAREYYLTADKTKTIVFKQKQGFPDSPFKTGRWYVSVASSIEPGDRP